MPHFDLVLKSGTVADGTQFPRYVADIGVSNGPHREVGDAQRSAEEAGRPVTDVFFEIVAQSGLDADFRTTEILSQDPAMNAAIARHKRLSKWT